MASNRSSDDFDDFFDTADQTSGESNKAKKSKDTASASRERGRDSDTESHSSRASRNQHRRSANRRSRSCSSRSTASSFTDSSRSRSPRRKDRKHNDSLSRSSSATSSRSRTDSYDSETREKTTDKKAKVSHRMDSNVSVDTAYTTEDDKHASNPRSRTSLRNQAWGKEAKSEKSQVRRNSTRRTSTDEKKLKQGRRGKKFSLADSDSDITDVSPISSPRNNHREFREQPDSKPPKCISKASSVLGDSKRPKNGGTKNAFELNLLEKAVSELEKQTRVQSNTRRVMFEPSHIRHEQKPNYTFSDHDTHRIDQENQRLLRQIMCQMHTMDGRYMGSFNKGKKSVIPASGINRLKDHNRIEKENLALLRRLQHIKPSRGISRQEQLSAYNTTLLHGVPISATHTLVAPAAGGRHTGSESTTAGSEAGSLGRTRSLTSVQSAGTTTSSVRSAQSGRRLRSRPSSAKTSVRERPPWDDRW